jgi:hypothetical protein
LLALTLALREKAEGMETKATARGTAAGFSTMVGISRAVPHSRFHHWTNDEILRLTDLHSDGYELASIAAQMGLSEWVIRNMGRKLGLHFLRGQTHAVQSNLQLDCYDFLKQAAKARHLRVNTLIRIILELACRSPEWLWRLLDDADRHLNDHDEALTVEKDNALPLPAPTVPAQISITMLPVSDMSSLLCPQLTGTVQ